MSSQPARGAHQGNARAPRRLRWTGVAAGVVVSTAGFAAVAVITVALARLTQDEWSLATGSGTATPDQLLVVGASGAALLLVGWLVLGTLAEVVAHLPGRVGRLARWMADHGAPALSRRVAAVLVGAATIGSLTPTGGMAASVSPLSAATAAAMASTTTAATHRAGDADLAPPTPSAPSVDGPGFSGTDPLPTDQDAPPGWVPTRPILAPAATPRLLGGVSTTGRSEGEVVVLRGDTLWDLARRYLGPKASDAEVAAAWPRWYAANRAVVGADPGRLLPGQILAIPGAVTAEATRQAHR